MGSRRTPVECVNLKCGSLDTEVVETALMPCGTRVRRRRCECCGHLWYTAQAPEEVIDARRLIWERGTGRRSGRPTGLRPPPESSKNRKV